MKKFILLSFFSLMSCNTVDNPRNCQISHGCPATSFCDFDTEVCKPNFVLQQSTNLLSVKEANQLAVVDMDNDKQLDIVIKTPSAVNVCYGAQAGNVRCISPLAYGLEGQSFMSIADLNHDDKPSILIVPHGSTMLNGQLFHNNNTVPPSFAAAASYPVFFPMINDVLPVDHSSADGGVSDLLIATDKGLYLMNFVTNPVRPNSIVSGVAFANIQIARFPSTISSNIRLQVAGIRTASGVAVTERPAQGNTFMDSNNFSMLPITRLRAADLDNNKTLDLVGAYDAGSAFYYSFGHDTGYPDPPLPIPAVSAVSNSFEIADLFSSGNQGLVVLSDKRTFAYLPGNGNGTFKAQTAVLQASDDISLFAVKDVTGDGRPDIVYVTAAGELKVAVNDKVHELVQVSDAL